MSFPRLTPSDPDYPRWSRSAATTINQLCDAADSSATTLTDHEARIDAAETAITALQGADTALDGRLDTLEAHYLASIIKLTPLAGDPASPAEGWVYANSTSHKLRYYDGTAWNDLF